MEKNKIILLLEIGLILIFLLFIGSAIVVNPFLGDINMIDEGQFGAWVRHMLAGEYLYIDTYSAYGPLYIFPLYLAAKVFGPSVFLIRIIYLVIFVLIAVLAIKLILEKLKINSLTQWITILVLLLIPNLGLRQGIGLISIFTLYLALNSRKKLLGFLAGVFLGISFLVSVDTGIFASLTCLGYIFFTSITAKDVYQYIKKLTLYALGLFVVFILFYAWSNYEGWFASFIANTFTDLSIYSSMALPNGKSFPNAISLMPQSFSIFLWIKFILSKEMLLYWLIFLYIISFLFLVVRFLMGRWKTEDTLLSLIAFFGFLLSTVLIGRYGHFAFTLAPGIVILSYFVNCLLSEYKKTDDKMTKLLSLLLVVLIAGFVVRVVSVYRPQFVNIFSIPSSIFSTENNPSFVGDVRLSDKQKEEIITIQDFVWRNTRRGDKVFFLGNEPMMYLLVDRDNPTRYDLPEVANTKQKRLEVLNDIRKDRTKFIIYNRNSWAVDEIDNFRRIPELAEYMQENYHKSTYSSFDIYILRN